MRAVLATCLLLGTSGLLLLSACDGTAKDARAPDGPPRAQVSIGVHVIDAEIADTPERQRRGLSGRPSLARGEGMLFVYDEPGLRGFWMPDMHFDIDIVWIRAGRIVYIESQAPHVVSGALPTYRPDTPADTVLEVVAGTADELGWRVGDPVRIERR
jgi:uncharacterized membrane protein (UPF0127 family)